MWRAREGEALTAAVFAATAAAAPHPPLVKDAQQRTERTCGFLNRPRQRLRLEGNPGPGIMPPSLRLSAPHHGLSVGSPPSAPSQSRPIPALLRSSPPLPT
ncbi:hypothetical protein E2C01_095837 [Portunus trituberculatus]|uniref:Uncharacterized protein n=1 Tax=Portunus trituberculatus TaxID=210409 RepID=A0A5B7JU33_PORTR|nr:hypothetical protein [Portunus trituberculatus]